MICDLSALGDSLGDTCKVNCRQKGSIPSVPGSLFVSRVILSPPGCGAVDLRVQWAVRTRTSAKLTMAVVSNDAWTLLEVTRASVTKTTTRKPTPNTTILCRRHFRISYWRHLALLHKIYSISRRFTLQSTYDHVQAGLITYAKEPKLGDQVHWEQDAFLNALQSALEAKRANLRPRQSSSSSTKKKPLGRRPGLQMMVILITDGRTCDDRFHLFCPLNATPIRLMVFRFRHRYGSDVSEEEMYMIGGDLQHYALVKDLDRLTYIARLPPLNEFFGNFLREVILLCSATMDLPFLAPVALTKCLKCCWLLPHLSGQAQCTSATVPRARLLVTMAKLAIPTLVNLDPVPTMMAVSLTMERQVVSVVSSRSTMALNECVDYDECQHENGGCSHICVNQLFGKPECQCPPGMVVEPGQGVRII